MSLSPFSEKLVSFLIINELVLTGMLGFFIFGAPCVNSETFELVHDAGNLDFKLDDHATLPFFMSYFGIQQSDSVGGWKDETFYFFDQSNYEHSGSGDIATGREMIPGGGPVEFTTTPSDTPLSLLENGVVDKSYGSFTKTKDILGQANDVRVVQTAWSKQGEDWGIIQWTNMNLFNSDLTEVRFGLRFYAAIGGDNSDDKAHWHPSDGVYYITDSGSTAYLGFASADPGIPLNMYWDGSIDDLAWDSDIYNAICASPYLSGFHNNLGCVVGWTDNELTNNGLTIPANSSLTRAMVIVGGNSLTDIMDGVEKAREFYKPRTLKITEIADEGAKKVEIHSIYSYPIDLSNYRLSVDCGSTYWDYGAWDTDPVPGFGYSVWTLEGTDSFGGFEGAKLGLYNSTSDLLLDEVAFGLYGTAPDPNDDVQRGSISKIKENKWVHSLEGMTFGYENHENASILQNPEVVINEVMFNPESSEYGFIELMYKGDSIIDIQDYTLITDSLYQIPDSVILSYDDPYHLIFRKDVPLLFDTGAMSNTGDNVYLYDDQNNLLDMVGWNSPHMINKTVTRIPEGVGDHLGFNDSSSIESQWTFDSDPSIPLVLFGPRKKYEFADAGDEIWYDLEVKNKLKRRERFDITYDTLENWKVGLFEYNRLVKLGDSDGDSVPDVVVDDSSSVNISVKITIPSTGISGDFGNSTIVARANSDLSIMHSALLQIRFNPYILSKKSVFPQQIFVNGTGYDEVATLTLEVVGSGFGIPSYEPQDIVFTIDRSNSMLPSEIDMAKQAVLEFIDNMSSPDRGAVVHFDAEIVLMGSLTSNYVKLKNDVENVPGPGDLTYMGEALYEALVELNNNGEDAKVHVIILITDGAWNGDLDPITVAHWARENKTLIFTIGMGNGAYNILLKEIADITGAENFTAETIDEFRLVYDQIAHYLDKTAGYDPDITDANPMIRDVLPPWIDYIPGSFSLEPDHISVNESGYTILEWNISSMFIGEVWKVTFNITSSQLGYQEANNYTSSRVSYINYDDEQIENLFPRTNINVIMPAPLPPNLSISVVNDLGNPDGKGDNILLFWEEPPSPGIVYYLLYRSTDQRYFDFSSPWIRTDLDDDCGIIPKRNTWNHTQCAKIGNPEYNQQIYYAIKAVNEAGVESITSRTVGKWTREFQNGKNTFSLPLEPIEIKGANWYLGDMNADYIRWMDQDHKWKCTGKTGENPDLMVGDGFEVKFPLATKYTFCGYPGAMIRYDDSQFGFQSHEARTLSAQVNDYKMITLTWGQPQSMDYADRFYVLRSETRDGFWGLENIDFQHIADLPYSTTSFSDYSIAQENTQYYYMVIPIESTTSECGSGSYSIGIFTKGFDCGYDTVSIPLKLNCDHSADWYCHEILYSLGINYFEYSENRWIWHKSIMPKGVYDVELVMAFGYQISTIQATRYSFVGI